MAGKKEKSDSSTRSAIDHMRHKFIVAVAPDRTVSVAPGIAEEESGRVTTTYRYIEPRFRHHFQHLTCPEEALPLIEEYRSCVAKADALRKELADLLTPRCPFYAQSKNTCGQFDTPIGPVMISGGSWFRVP